ncbi:MAG: hypothetical protein AB1589_29890 [Cyanobacteriota bacterium]
MQQPPPPSSPLQPENKYPNWLYMKLEAIAVQAEQPGIFKLKSKSLSTEQIQLYLTLQFNEYREPLPRGQIRLGLKGGELKLRLDNGNIPLPSRKLNGSIELIRQPGKPNQNGMASQPDATVPLRESQVEEPANLALKEIQKNTQQSLFTVCQVTAQGSEEKPSWVFAAEKDQPVLRGLLKRALLGTLQVTAKPCRVEVTFCISPQDIYIDTEMLLPNTISKKKKTVIERALVRRLLKRKLTPYLSRQELRYE